MAARFAPTQFRVDTSKLSPGDRRALTKLIESAHLLNDIFLQQLWGGNPVLYAKLQKDRTPLGQARLHYFWINKGPWSELDDNKAFLPGVPPRKPLAANFYTENMTKEQFESWLSSLPADEQEQAKNFFTVIRWKSKPAKGKGAERSPEQIRDQLQAVPYSQEYKSDLTRAADLLREAAGLTDNPSLKKFLTLRADAFLSND